MLVEETNLANTRLSNISLVAIRFAAADPPVPDGRNERGISRARQALGNQHRLGRADVPCKYSQCPAPMEQQEHWRQPPHSFMTCTALDKHLMNPHNTA